MNKRILIGGAVILLVIGAIVFIIASRSSNEPAPPPPEEEQPIAEEPVEEPPEDTPAFPTDGEPAPLPEEETPQPELRVEAVSSDVIISPVLALNGEAVWYFTRSGELVRYDLATREVTPQDLPLVSNLLEVLWPVRGNDFIVIQRSTQGLPRKRLFDAAENTFIDLPQQIQNLDWFTDGERIAYSWLRADGGMELKVANSDSTDYEKVTDLFQPDYVIKVSPEGDSFLLYRQPASDRRVNKLYKVSADGSSFVPLILEGHNTGARWLPDGSGFLFTRWNDARAASELWYVNLASTELKNLGLSTSLDKIAVSRDSKTLYFALPRSIPQADFLVALPTEDVLWKMDLVTLEKTPVVSEDEFGSRTDMRDLFLNLDESILFYVNGWDSKLYSAKLE
jgi:hypothetical protein